MMKGHHVRYLQQFVHILPGDLVLLPTDGRCYQVHLGVVVPPRCQELARAGIPAYYYYYFDIPGRNWYENAHRVARHPASASAPSEVLAVDPDACADLDGHA